MQKHLIEVTLANIEWDTEGDLVTLPASLAIQYESDVRLTDDDLAGITSEAPDLILNDASDMAGYLISDCIITARRIEEDSNA